MDVDEVDLIQLEINKIELHNKRVDLAKVRAKVNAF